MKYDDDVNLNITNNGAKLLYNKKTHNKNTQNSKGNCCCGRALKAINAVQNCNIQQRKIHTHENIPLYETSVSSRLDPLHLPQPFSCDPPHQPHPRTHASAHTQTPTSPWPNTRRIERHAYTTPLWPCCCSFPARQRLRPASGCA